MNKGRTPPADAYVDAFTRSDADALVKLLRVDVEMEMPPIPTWFTGRDAVVGFLASRVLRARGPVADAAESGQRPACARRAQTRGRRLTSPTACRCSRLIGGRIARITAFNDPGLVPTSRLGRAATRPDHGDGPPCGCTSLDPWWCGVSWG